MRYHNTILRQQKIASQFKEAPNSYPAGTANGSDNYIEVADNDVLDFGTGVFSICWWAKYPQTQTNTNAGIISKGAYGVAPAKSWAIVHNAGNTDGLQLLMASDAGGSWNVNKVLVGSGITDGWHSFVFVRSTSTNAILYQAGGS